MNHIKTSFVAILMFHVLSQHLAFAQEQSSLANQIEQAIERSLPLLEIASAETTNQRQCFTCHGQALPIVALMKATQHGFQIDSENLKRQVDHTFAHLERSKTEYDEGKGTGGQVDTAGWALWGLEAGKHEANEFTDSVVSYLVGKQDPSGVWTCSSNRPPSEASDFSATYLALRALDAFGRGSQTEKIEAARTSARTWFESAKPRDTEDMVFQLLTLRYLGLHDRAPDLIAQLKSQQRQDGGWAQLPELGCDAYATGTVLYALAEAGMDSSEPEYRRGLEFLLTQQLPDGSWHVKSRSVPFQLYFETGYPHGKDQFISMTAGCWATMALLNALPEQTPPIIETPDGTQSRERTESNISGSLMTGANRFSPEDEEFFEARIRPVLHDRCVECHGANEQQGGLRLDSREALLQGGESGPALVLGNPETSLLLKAIRHQEPDLKMPPPEAGAKLADSTIDDFSAWVKSGAAWPKSDSPTAVANKESFDLGARKERLPWIWQTPQPQSVPEIPDSPHLTEVDRFILEKLQQQGLTLAKRTDDLTWLRRVHFAITGLPPRREQIQTFLADASLERRQHVVDTLLASPHFGERWARHWMDLMRYAESRGHESDYLIANAWQYRDYLIRALNADLPYDRFVAEHLAGDLIKARLHPETRANESVLATGWAFLGEEVHSPVDIRQDECERIDNKVDVLSKTFLGLTVACARCHDHKFDAISQQDYYALSGFVLGSSFRQVRFETMVDHEKAVATLAQLREQFAAKTIQAFADSVRPKLDDLVPFVAAACRVISGEQVEMVAQEMQLDVVRLGAWVDHLRQAQSDPAHPLHVFSTLASDAELDSSAATAVSLAEASVAEDAISPDTVIADFMKSAGETPWRSNGPAFGDGPLVGGELIFGTCDKPIARVMPFGAAVRDSFWNGLSLTPGTELDSGRLGAAERAGKTLLTRKWTLGTAQLHYLIRGQMRVYAGVDSHLMLEGPLHGALVADFDSAGQLRWVSHNLSAYAGHRVHLELSPLGEQALDLLMVVESPETPKWLPIQSWRPSQPTSSRLAAAEALQADVATVISDLATKADIEPRLLVLADWLVQNSSLLDVDLSPVITAADEYFRAQAELAETIRWDSRTAVSLTDVTGVDENVLIRGKPTRLGAVAPRGLPEAFGLPRITATDTSGRAELARQIIDPSNPLVARVMVNRVWHHLFGRGIVPTVDNFGYLGEPPSHPELLDQLAWQFIHEDNWSLKRLIRKLVLSETFAQSSRASSARANEVDPANLLLHRMPVRRLEGEAIRDALLVTSGRLDPTTYGPPVPIHLTDFIIGRGRPEVSGPLDGAGRRSIYVATRRNFLSTMMLAFDYPTPFSCVGRRNVTNVPAQVLTMMNDPFVRQQADVWAKRLIHELPNTDETARIVWLFETGYCRQPSPDELRFCVETLDELRTQYAGDAESVVWSELCHALLNSNDFIYLK
jgi:hypothetical protein